MSKDTNKKAVKRKARKNRTTKQSPPQIDFTEYEERTNADAVELLKLIDDKLSVSARNVETRSLWEVAWSAVYWLKMAHKDHPTVKRYIEGEQNFNKYSEDSNIIKSSYKNKVAQSAGDMQMTTAEVFLLTGFLMGIRALHDQKPFTTDDCKKAAAAYRLMARPPRRWTEEEDEQERLYWAKRN
jgi:hypothetical protein